ncbi:MAG: DNA-3-methyladenine glycosylase [Cyanobacteria bacterium J06638_20]
MNAASTQTLLPVEHTWLSRSSTDVAPDLVGCTLVRQLPDGTQYRGLIVETEAYAPGDPACHAYRRRSKRNEVMFGSPGACYVYLIYGIYHCINVVTDGLDVPSAVLIRALELEVIPTWVDAKQQKKPHRVAAGPGKLCRTLKIDLSLNGTILQTGEPLWLEHRSQSFQAAIAQGKQTMTQTTRIGLTQGTDLPWRWYLTDCSAVSKK